MNKGMQMMLKALGLEITSEHIAMLQALIPQLPAKINEVAQAINAALANFDSRLRVIEARLDAIGHEQSLNFHAVDEVICSTLRVTKEYHEMLKQYQEETKQYQEVLNALGNTARISDTPGPGAGAGRRGSRTRTANGGDGNGSAGEPGNTGG